LENLAELISVAAEFEAQVEAADAAATELEEPEEDADIAGAPPVPGEAAGPAPGDDADSRHGPESEPAPGTDVAPDAALTAPDDPEASLIDRFLEKVSLVADADQIPGAEDQFVTLLTLHTAKGLAFPVAFLTGVGDGSCPATRSLGDPMGVVEGCRLGFGGSSRAWE